jgi:hypothetical protein
MVGSPDPVGISAPRRMWSFDSQWTVVSEEKDSGSELERGEQPFGAQGKRAGMGCGSFRQGPDGVGTSRNLRSGLRVNKHERE